MQIIIFISVMTVVFATLQGLETPYKFRSLGYKQNTSKENLSPSYQDIEIVSLKIKNHDDEDSKNFFFSGMQPKLSPKSSPLQSHSGQYEIQPPSTKQEPPLFDRAMIHHVLNCEMTRNLCVVDTCHNSEVDCIYNCRLKYIECRTRFLVPQHAIRPISDYTGGLPPTKLS